MALLEGTLSLEASDELQNHIRYCSDCRLLVVKMASALVPAGQSLNTADDSSIRALGLTWSTVTSLSELSQAWEPPSNFDEYQLGDLLGHGTMGRVYRGHDVRMDRPVAIKFLAAREPDAAACERFLIEARAIGRLSHPNVVTCYRAGEVSGRPYIVYQLINGPSLDQLSKPVPWQRALAIAIDLARGLGAAHERGVLHRDIKPANVLIGENGEAKLLDFGLAKLTGTTKGRLASSSDIPAADSIEEGVLYPGSNPTTGLSAGAEPSLTATGSIVGTPLFIAPEIWRGEEATAQADVYSLGVLLYELCTGRLPHQAATLAALRQDVLTTEALPLTGADSAIPVQFSNIVARCLRRTSKERFASGQELCAALEQILNVAPAHPRRFRALTLGVGASVLVLVVAIAIWLQVPISLILGTPPKAPQLLSRASQSPSKARQGAEREIAITVAGLPALTIALRITADIDGQRVQIRREFPDNLQSFGLALPPGNSGRSIKLEIAAFDRVCSIAAGRRGIGWRADDPRELTVTMNDCRGCWCGENPPMGKRFNGVWAASEQAVFVVGDNMPILRYDGLSWIQETPGDNHHYLVTAWGRGPDDVWAVGGCGNPQKDCPYPLGQRANVVLHRDAVGWKTEASFGSGYGQLYGIWAIAPHDVWVVGNQGVPGMTRGLIAHKDQHGWKELPEGPTLGSSLHGIWGFAKDDVWIVGDGATSGVIWHHTGNSSPFWQPASLPQPLLKHHYGVWGVDPKLLLVTGSQGNVLRWDGVSWQYDCSPSGNGPRPSLNNIWGRNREDIWSVGNDETVLRWDPSHQCWSQMAVPLQFCVTENSPLSAVWGTAREVWAVGNCNAVLHYRSK